MNAVIAILMTVTGERNGELQGRTLLQKKLYFLSTLLSEDYGYVAHYYGPYSSKIADAVDTLVSGGFLAEKTEVFPAANVFGEVRRYSYTVTEDGRKILDHMACDDDFKKWGSFLTKLNSCDMSNDFNVISIAAKIHYIVSEKGRASIDEIKDRATKLGWMISEKDIEKVTSELKLLGLTS